MTERILLIEDDDRLAGMVRDYLGEAGFDVTIAGTGNEGLALQKDRGFGDDGARKALLKVFDILGDDPAVTRYRARLFNLLH